MERKAKIYLQKVGDKSSLKTEKGNVSNEKFRFGDVDQECSGILKLRMSFSEDIVINFDAGIVPIDVSLLFGLDVLQKLRLLVNFDDATLFSINDDWIMHFMHRMGHMYAKWPSAVYYTEVELKKIHEHVFHPTKE